MVFLPGVGVQRAAGCDSRRPTNSTLPANGQLDGGGRVQEGPPVPLEAPARGPGGGGLCETSGGVLPGERKRPWLELMGLEL